MCLGLIGVVWSVGDSSGLPYAVVDLGGRQVEAPVLVSDELRAGDHVMLHSGYVVEAIDPEMAEEMLEARRLLADSA